jgi:hypothetical protein
LKLSHQIAYTLNEFIQGSFTPIQDLLIKSNLMETLNLLFALCIDTQREVQKVIVLIDGPLFPEVFNLRYHVKRHREPLKSALIAYEQHRQSSLHWTLLRSISKLEIGMLDLISGLMEISQQEESPITLSLERHDIFVRNIDMRVIIERFKVYWAALVFDPLLHLPEYLSQNQGSNRTDSNNEETFWNQIGIMSMILQSGSKAFFSAKENLKYISEQERTTLLTFWSIKSKEEIDCDVEVAFAYYRNINSVCDMLTNVQFMEQCSEEMKLKLVAIQAMSSPGSKSSMLSLQEILGYDRYFASIEVVLDKVLQRIYFPIPEDCRDQMLNRIVLAEKKDLMDNVNRNSPEDKLDNFLDMSLQVRDVIQQQQYLLKTSQFRGIFQVVSGLEKHVINITFLLTFLLNGYLLIHVHSGNLKENNYLPSYSLQLIFILGCVHLLLSSLLLCNFLLGTALVNINLGFKWKRNVMDGIITLDYLQSLLGNAASGILFELANTFLPDLFWALIFLLIDLRTIYHFLFLAFSLLGLVYNPAFFCFHTLDIVMRIPILGYVIKSVTMNIDQVVVTFLLGAVLMWIYAVSGVYTFGYNQYNYGDSPDFEWPESLASAYWQHMDFGLRGPPIFSSYKYQSTAKYLFDISYQIFIIVIMVAIITGIIIDTFGDLRSARAEVLDNQQNVCFICGLSRQIFERNRCVSSKRMIFPVINFVYLSGKCFLIMLTSTIILGNICTTR